MKTFFNILQAVANIKNKKYPNEPFTVTNVSEINEIVMIVQTLIENIFYTEKNYTGKRNRGAYSKITSLSLVLNNVFYKNELKKTIETIFSKAQKHYFAFSKLALIYKINKYKTVVSDDFSLNPLERKHKNTFELIEQKCKYLFSLNDLVTIIENAIGNAPDFFAEPLSPSNPYNKQPFTHSTLYNIYFKLKASGRLISVLFHLFFLENFNKMSFCENHEEYIRERAIKEYVYNMPYTTLYPYVRHMLENDISTKNLNIHPDFPKDILVNIFRPYLYYFFIVKHTIKGTNKHFNYNQKLGKKLKQFYYFNTSFGRKHIQITRYFGEVVQIEHSFNMKHINFYGVKTELPHKKKITYYQPINLVPCPQLNSENYEIEPLTTNFGHYFNDHYHFNYHFNFNFDLDFDLDTIVQEELEEEQDNYDADSIS